MSPLSRDLKRSGELAYAKVEKVNSELFSLTYGAVVMQVLQDYEDVDATNAQLEKMSAPSPCRAQSHRAAPVLAAQGIQHWRAPHRRVPRKGAGELVQLLPRDGGCHRQGGASQPPPAQTTL